LFGRKSKKRNQGIEEKEPEEEQVVDPYDDEPNEWKQLSDEKRARAWYDLESLTTGSSPPLSLPVDQGNPFSAYYDEAHRGNRCAEYALGKMYLTGTLTQQNTFQAGLWFSQASDLGSPFSCYELAKMMNLGIGFGKDPASAEQLYQKAYQSLLEIENRSPHPSIEKKLAVICENGLCSNADPSAASRWRQLTQGVSPFVEMDMVEAETGRGSIQKADVIGTETGRASNDQKRVRKNADLPGAPEFFVDGPTSSFDGKTDATKTETGRGSIPKPDVVGAETGRASNDQKRVRKSADLPGAPEFFVDGPASAFDGEMDDTEPETGRASSVREIPVEYIYPAKDNPYAANDTDEALYALAMSIQINGLLNPLVLHKISDTEYRIISGEKRYMAITRYLHWSTIRATVKENLSANAARLMLHAANLDVREYTSAQKLKFYMDAKKLLQRMKESGEYSGPLQKGIADLLGMSEHQVRKYQKIMESLPRRQLNRIKSGEISLEKAYRLARAAPVKQDKSGRASECEKHVRKSEDFPGTAEFSDDGPASALEEKPDVSERETGRASECKNHVRKNEDLPGAPEFSNDGPASALEEKPDVSERETGRASECKNHVRKNDDLPGTAELSDDGPASALEEKPDVSERETGRASECENRVRKNEDFPGAPEFSNDGPASALEEKPDVSERETGPASALEEKPDVSERASLLKMDAAETAYEDPQTYQEAISLLARLPTAPGDTCAVRDREEIVIGTVDRMEVYQNALLISVLIDGIRRPYPVSLIGTELFLGPDCYRLAEGGQSASSF
jgi:ParB-like chromosome segregation protein Spo0J